MPEDLHGRIKREREATSPDVVNIDTYRRYAQGEQTLTLTADQKNALGAAANKSYSDNVADMVLSAWSSRLILTGYSSADSAVQQFLDDFYMRSEMGDLSYDINYATGRDGNHAVMLRWLPEQTTPLPPAIGPQGDEIETVLINRGGRVTAHAEDWWDGKTGVWVSYDDYGRPAYAVKDFKTWLVVDGGVGMERERRTVYFPDHIERFILDGNGWRPYPLPGESENGRVEWTKRDGSPLGIPIVHFKFPRFGRRRYGWSELAGGVIGNQDQLNDIQMDIANAAKLLGFQIVTATGATFSKVPKMQPGTLLHTENANAKFGNIPAGDISQLKNAHGIKLSTIARMTATPIHIITGGDWPAGIALVQAEKPLIAKIFRLAKTIGPSHQEVAHRATEIANAFGSEGLNENAPITAVFADPEQLDQLAQAEVLKAKAEAQAALELLTDPEGLAVAAGIPVAEAKRRIEARQERANQQLEIMAGFDRGATEDGEEDQAA
jgi:hypothetical protein